ncbi:MAG TPA: hypothetical protein VLM40_16135, partial [Gemmata sp.]|nr:hypothetical protein [Gemmata sp.]
MKWALLALVLPVTLGFAPSTTPRLSRVTVFPAAAEDQPRPASAVQVLTVYPGMRAESIEHDITIRMERWVGQ